MTRPWWRLITRRLKPRRQHQLVSRGRKRLNLESLEPRTLLTAVSAEIATPAAAIAAPFPANTAHFASASPLATADLGPAVQPASVVANVVPAIETSTLSTTVSSNGGQQVFAIGTDGQVWTQVPGTIGNPGTWALTQSGQVQQVAATIDNSGNIVVFALGTDDQVWFESSTGNGIWTPWALTQTGFASQIAVPLRVSPAIRTQLFIIGGDSQVWSETANGAGGWNPWTLTRAGGVQQISAMIEANGTVNVFALGADNQVWFETAPTGTNNWSAWTLSQTGPVQQVSAPLLFNNHMIVFAIGTDGQVWSETSNGADAAAGSGFAPWTLTQVGIVRQISTAVDGAGRPRVYASGIDQQVWSETFNPNSSQWLAWTLTAVGAVQ